MRKLKTAKRVAATFRHNGLVPGLRDAATTGWHWLYTLGPWYSDRHLYEEDWDLAIILDACRPDSIRERTEEYQFLREADRIESTLSVGSWSGQWMERTFVESDRDFSDTAYITGNPFSHRYLDQSEFGLLDEVWRDAWNEEHGTVLAETMTARAIHVGREYSYERVIVHYMQPHFPSIPDPLGDEMDITIDSNESLGEEGPTAWELQEQGKVSLKRLRDSYEENLDYVLDAVKVLINNFEAETVVLTGDHGQAFGELGLTAHPIVPYGPVREIPWLVTTGQDTGTRKGMKPPKQAESEAAVHDRLRDLGYI